MMPNIITALRDWGKVQAGGVLIGALALSYYARPRMTQDVDFLFEFGEDVPTSVSGITRAGDHEFPHDGTKVKIDLITSKVQHVPPEIIRQVMDPAVESDGIKIASASGLVALKLHRLSMQDKAEIIALIKTDKVDVSGFALPLKRMRAFLALEAEAPHDLHPV